MQDDAEAAGDSHGSILERLRGLFRTAIRRLRAHRKDAKSS